MSFCCCFRASCLSNFSRIIWTSWRKPYLRYLGEIENQLSKYVSPKIDPLKIRRMACAVAGFVFGFLSFAMIGMTEKQIDDSLKPLKRAFVSSLSEFLGR